MLSHVITALCMFCSQSPCLCLKPYTNSITVLLILSTAPLEDDFNGVDFTSVTSNSFNKALNSLDINSGPLCNGRRSDAILQKGVTVEEVMQYYKRV